ncbi:hypothetical protein [Fibrisoma montanum]|nr:hypothetical protein [Fibrisoma montanum]
MKTENYFLPASSFLTTVAGYPQSDRAGRTTPTASVRPLHTRLNKLFVLNCILVALVLVGVTGSGMAKPRDDKRPATTQPQLARAVIAHVTYPKVMAEGNYAGVVVVTFRIAEDSRVSQVTVHTANRKLNDELTGQLLGKKIQVPDLHPDDVCTVRLRFRH